MPEVVAIGLNQLVLWYDATRIQTWPAFLATIPDGLVLRSATDFGRRFETERMTDKRHAASEKLVRNLPGLEKIGTQLVLKGVGLLEKTEGGYRLSQWGQEIGYAYASNAKGREWVRQLARLLLTREPRIRAIIWCLGREGAELRFAGNGWFTGLLREASMEVDGTAIYPFVGDRQDTISLRTLLREHSWWALGAWRSDPLVAGARNCRYTGTLKEELSLHDVSLALRGPFEVLLHLGILKSNGSRCYLDQQAAVEELGPETASDFGWTASGSRADIGDLLYRLVPELRSDTGYVVASELREALRREGIENPDAEIAKLQEEGRVVIEAEDYGQARHGVGLFGDPRKQMVQIRLTQRTYS